MSNWILGTSIDSTREDEVDTSENFVGYLVHLEHPRCMIALGNIDMLSEQGLFSLSPDEGYFFANEDKNFSLVLVEWLDEPIANTNQIKDLLCEAATHYSIQLEDLMESSVDEVESVT